jgi:hypothetical protein
MTDVERAFGDCPAAAGPHGAADTPRTDATGRADCDPRRHRCARCRARRARRERPAVRAGWPYYRAAPIKGRSGSCRRGRSGANTGTCPVRAVRAWLTVAGDDGAVFRRIDRHGNIGASLTATAIASIIRVRASAAGVPGDFAGHSLRAGFATTAAHAGRSEASIMRHGRWKSVQVARRYIRHSLRWLDNPAAGLGL